MIVLRPGSAVSPHDSNSQPSSSGSGCFTCEKELSGPANLFLTDIHGCSATASVDI
ncbi:MAG: hypothetical protein P8R42_24025 [Candidatus Binatia bacterium]|nr:hypothetical protein [Candidatus Binatia bacterium]